MTSSSNGSKRITLFYRRFIPKGGMKGSLLERQFDTKKEMNLWLDHANQRNVEAFRYTDRLQPQSDEQFTPDVR